MKFITMKYGLNSDNFVVDVIYKGDIIPQDYTLIDVAYYYKWEKQAPMQFFYRIFKKNKVLLKRRKRKSKSEDKISDGKKPKLVECANNNKNNHNDSAKAGQNEKKNGDNVASGKSPEKSTEASNKGKENGTREILGCQRAVMNKPPPTLAKEETKKDIIKKEEVNKKTNDFKKANKDFLPPTLKPILPKKEAEPKKEAKPCDTIEDDSDSDDDDKPPSEKKLKIDESQSSSSNNELKINLKLNGEAKSNSGEKKELVKKEESKPVCSSPTLIKPKLTNGNMLTDIVNNLAKKQMSNSLNSPDSKANKAAPPSSLLGGQTTITPKHQKVQSKESKSAQDQKKLDKKDPNAPKGIPSGTTVTVRNISPSSASSASSSTATAKVSFSNTFKSRNGSSSMMDFVQATTSPGTMTSASLKKSSSSSGSSSSLASSPSSSGNTLSDLRQFRKDSSGVSKPSSQRSPIIPTLTLGKSGSNASSNSSNSSSSFSALSKPLPKPGEASTANFLAQQANSLSALAALGLGLTDEQQKAIFRNMATAAAMLPPPSLPPTSVTQQLPSNRLKLTMTPSSSSGSNGGGHKNNVNSFQMLPSLASHMAPESQWKMFSPLAAAAAASSNGHHQASKFGSFSKTLNQSIRQIPNPSLLTAKQASDHQQNQLALQRALASYTAASVAAASARTSLSQ